MWNRKLCLNLIGWADKSETEVLNAYADAGFDGFFTGWTNLEQMKTWKALADERGLLYKNVHAPFYRVNQFWDGTGDPEAVLEEQLACLRDCAALGVETMVSHVFIGFEYTAVPSEAGVAYFEKIAREAERLGIKVAFENTEGEEFLAAVLELAKTYKSVGFCLDTGHEMCYNHSKDLLLPYGHLLSEVHLNDNLGIRDFDGVITGRDDLHLLPFDGVADWDYNAARLARCGYTAPLCFELKGNCAETEYSGMSLEGYVAGCYRSACKVATLVEKHRKAHE